MILAFSSLPPKVVARNEVVDQATGKAVKVLNQREVYVILDSMNTNNLKKSCKKWAENLGNIQSDRQHIKKELLSKGRIEKARPMLSRTTQLRRVQIDQNLLARIKQSNNGLRRLCKRVPASTEHRMEDCRKPGGQTWTNKKNMEYNKSRGHLQELSSY